MLEPVANQLPTPSTKEGRLLKKAVDAAPKGGFNCMQAIRFVAAIVTALLDLVPKGKIPLIDYVSTLVFAAARGISLHQAEKMVPDGPCRRSFDRNFTPFALLSKMILVCNRLLAETAAQVMMFVKGQITLAMDLTEIPFYGKHEDNPDIRGGKAKLGTSRFYMYLTLFVVLAGKRVTLAIEPYQKEDELIDVVRRMLDRCSYLHRVRYLLMDRQFTSAVIMKELEAREIPFIGAIKKNATIKEIISQQKGSQIVPQYRVNGFEGRLYIKACNIAGLRGKHGRTYRTFITSRCTPSPLTIDDVYRKRFGIEASYRIMNQAFIHTSTTNPGMRLLMITLALTLENIWVLLKYHFSAEPSQGKRGPKEFDDDAMPFEVFLELLMNGVRIIYGLLLSIQLPRSVTEEHLHLLLKHWSRPMMLEKEFRRC